MPLRVSGGTPAGFGPPLAPAADGAYLVTDPFVQIAWESTGSGRLTDTPVVYGVCYQPRSVPDLAADDLDTSGLVVNFDTLAVSGVLRVTVSSRQGAAVTTPFSLLFFDDTDGNGTYSAGVDTVLAQGEIAGLAANEARRVELAASGAVRFVGDPVYAWVDSGQVIAETDENNNLAFARCAAPTP